jgi:soluble lytic murein transglycosylase-like protein
MWWLAARHIELEAIMHSSNLQAVGKALTTVLRNGLAGFGALILASLILESSRALPEKTPHAAELDSNGPREHNAAMEVAPDPRHKVLASYLARRYRVSAEATENMVSEAYAAGRHLAIDPLLILAVISVESRFNPIAESNYGAKGLMQVVPKYHQEKLADHGGEVAVLDPRTNILIGTKILAEYIRRAGGLEAGLQFYGGAPDDPAQGYAQRVIAERQRLQQKVPRPARSGTDV